MSRTLVRFCTVVGILLLATPLMAQTYDITDYMMLTPGQWKMEQGQDACEGFTWQEAVVVSSRGPYTLGTWYEKEGDSWVKQSTDIYEITPDTVLYHGENSYDPLEAGLWLLDPPISIPRTLALYQPVINTGVITHDTTTITYTHTLMIVEAGLTVSTPAGTFNNCLKIIECDMLDENAESEIMIWAPGLGEVKTWSAEVENYGPDVEMDTDIFEAINYGSF